MVDWPFERPPRAVQTAALEQGHMRKGFGYFMRMRMGKTGTVLADWELHRRAGRVDYAIVVVPNSLKRAWVDALGEWGLDMPRCMYEANRKKEADLFFSIYPFGLFVINYDSLKHFFNVLVPTYDIDLNRCMLICDESTSFKSADTDRSKILVKQAHKFGYTRVLSGKPRANSNLDLWSQLKVIGATEQGWFGFRATYCYMGGWEGRQVVADKNNEQLAEVIRANGFIAGDEYLKDLPEKIYMPLVQVEMTKEQAKHYKEMEKDFYTSIGDDDTCTASIALTKYLRLRQLTSGIYTGENGMPTNMFPMEDNPRIKATMELIESTPNKVLVIANFVNSLDSLYRSCQEAGYEPSLLVGGMKPNDIEEQKWNFNNGNAKVMIGQEAIMQFGHMLAGSDDCPCDTIIFYENDFSLINRAQSEARPEVLGRHVPIAIYDFYSSPMDRHITEALRSKENGAIALMGYSRGQGILPLVPVEEVVSAAENGSDNEFLQQAALRDALAMAGF